MADGASGPVWRGRSGPTGTRSGPPIVRGFEWRYESETRSLQVRIPEWLFRYYRSRPRGERYGVYVADPFDRDLLGAVAGRIDRFTTKQAFDDVDTVEFAASFVQQLEYVPDDVSTAYDHYPRYPVETLVHRGGDCVDASVLLAALLRELGYDVALLRLPGHIQVGVALPDASPGGYYEADGNRYYVLEATGQGWDVGEVPSKYEGERADVVDVSDVPVVVHRWSAHTLDESGRVAGRVQVTDLGDGVADRLTATVRFETETGREIAAGSHAFPDVAPGETSEWTFTLQVSPGLPVRGTVDLTLDGRPHDESASAYLEP